MPNVTLYTKFDFTDASGNTYSDGSTVAGKTINIDTGEIFDRTYSIASATITEILSDSNITDFDFLWIESDQGGEIQLVTQEGGTVAGSDMEAGFVLGINAGIPFVLSNDDSRNFGDVTGTMNEANYASEIDTWETNWSSDTIDRIEWYHTSGATAKVRVVAIT